MNQIVRRISSENKKAFKTTVISSKMLSSTILSFSMIHTCIMTHRMTQGMTHMNHFL